MEIIMSVNSRLFIHPDIYCGSKQSHLNNKYSFKYLRNSKVTYTFV